MIKYIIEKTITNDYAQGVQVLTDDDGDVRKFNTEKDAIQWLSENDAEFNDLPISKLIGHYNIKPYVI